MIKQLSFFFCGLFIWSMALEGQNINISGNPSTMTISTATAGSPPNSVTDTSTTYSLDLISVLSKIVGSIDSNMPTGLTLKVQLAPPLLTTSTQQTMTTTPKDLITNIGVIVSLGGLQITYTLEATAQAAAQSGSRTLTLAIVPQ